MLGGAKYIWRSSDLPEGMTTTNSLAEIRQRLGARSALKREPERWRDRAAS